MTRTRPKADFITRRFSRLARRFGRDRKGAAALEFAIVATPFFLLLFAVIEIAFMFVLSMMIDNATTQTGREIRTGQMQSSGATADDLWDSVCDRVKVIATCDGRLFVDVSTFNDFSSARTVNPISDGDFDGSGLAVDFGESGDIVLVRVFYVWDVFFPTLGTGLANLNGGKRLLVSTAAFRNEPFGDVGTGG